MKQQWYTFLTAVMFFTRIPVEKNLPYSETFLNSSSKFLPVIGWIVGGISGLAFWGLNLFLPHTLAILLSMAVSILITGAFHEDGFADACDGFGGGWSKEKILVIMKDSRIGAYGMIGMFFMLFTKYTALSALNTGMLPFVMIAGHTFSRYSSALFMFTSEYVREDQTSKSKPLGKQMKPGEFVFASLTTLPPLLLFKSWWIVMLIPFTLIVTFLFAKYVNKWIGGYTGDCLGAMQQISEVSVYVFLISVSNLIV